MRNQVKQCSSFALVCLEQFPTILGQQHGANLSNCLFTFEVILAMK